MKESFIKNRKGILLMFCSSICVCIGQLLWKMSTTGNLIEMIIGFVFYGMGALLMIIAYRYGKVSVLQPMLSMNYVFSIFLGGVVLHEAITVWKMLGIIIIICGVILIGGGDEE